MVPDPLPILSGSALPCVDRALAIAGIREGQMDSSKNIESSAINFYSKLHSSSINQLSQSVPSNSININMRLQFLLPALAVMASTARAAMNLFVNDCEWDIYVTQVGIAGPEGGTQLLSAGHMTHVPQFNTGTGQYSSVRTACETYTNFIHVPPRHLRQVHQDTQRPLH